MSAKKASAPAGPITQLFSIFSGRGKLFALLILIAAAIGGGYALWREVRGHVLAGSQYQLDPREIHVNVPPPWVRADVKAQVIRDASLDTNLSILEEDLTLRIAQAFALHPWVEKVIRVSKGHPARVDVELEFRQPAAMVEVTGGLLPVDRLGVLLPSDDFTSTDARAYPRLAGITTEPVGVVGKSWGDVRVMGGSALAALLLKHWQPLKLHRIQAAGKMTGGASTADDTFELVTQAGTQVVWGRAPGHEISGELPAQDKLARLLKFAEANKGTLEPTTGTQRIDLRTGPEPTATPRTATRSSSPDTVQ